VALSDLAAMGAEAGEAYVALGLPADLGDAATLELLDGISEVAMATGTTLAGGDLTRAPVLVLAVTVVGHSPSAERLVGRRGARPGDVLVLTGELGAAAAGLLALGEPEAAAGLPSADLEELLRRQLEPIPRMQAGRALAAAGATAMIDLSDGLGGDARRLAEAGGVGLRIDAEALPLAAGVVPLAEAAGRDALQLAISGGEDYELLAALPGDVDLEELARSAGLPVTRIGEAVAEQGVEIRLPREGRSLEARGFDQLRDG
jgi:thiamine-monophosphate kinase